jgi:hypothetical protein
MIALARPEHERWLEEQFADEGKFARLSVMTVAEITSDWDAPPGLTNRNVPTALRTAGFERGPEVKLDGKPVVFWIRRGALIAKDEPKTLKDRYAKERSEGAGEAARSSGR